MGRAVASWQTARDEHLAGAPRLGESVLDGDWPGDNGEEYGRDLGKVEAEAVVRAGREEAALYHRSAQVSQAVTW